MLKKPAGGVEMRSDGISPAKTPPLPGIGGGGGAAETPVHTARPTAAATRTLLMNDIVSGCGRLDGDQST